MHAALIGKCVMQTKSICLTVRLDYSTHVALKNFVRGTSVPVSAIVRNATEHYLRVLQGRTEEQQRKQLSSEYLALAIDLIISNEYPAFRDDLIAEAVQRLETVNANVLKGFRP
jgi:hypothetical protein